jgi:hypothetical protein
LVITVVFLKSVKNGGKTNLYYLQDKISYNNFFLKINIINNQILVMTDNTLLPKPEQYRADVELKYNMSPTSLLEYNFRIKDERITTPTEILQNNTEYSSFLDSRYTIQTKFIMD